MTLLTLGLIRILPDSWALGLGRGFALLVWAISHNWRRTADRNIQLFYHGVSPHPSEDPAWRCRVARASAVSLGYQAIEFMLMGVRPVEHVLKMIVKADGMELLKEKLAKEAARGRGIIIVSLHYGNWELCGACLADRSGVLHAVGKEQRDPFFTRLAFPWRERFGIRNIMAGDKVSSAILRALAAGHMLGLISDQNGGRRGIFAPFGAQRETALLASNAGGAAALSLRTGSPPILCYTRRIAPGKLHCIAGPEVDMTGIPGHDPATGKYTPEALVEAISRINEQIARVIDADPSQWLWGHKRWKTRPQGEPPLY
jgi:KDO2-lipid IV(A) lauroyltransferase